MRFAVVSHHLTSTNESLVAHAPAATAALVLTPTEALASLRAGDVAIGRIDVAPTLDGVEPGLRALAELEDRGVRVLNRPGALLAAHDKLLTARTLGAAGTAHPLTQLVAAPTAQVAIRPPVVVKPRFGSWGRDVHLCPTLAALQRTLADLADRRWFRAQGALVQELVPISGFDLRVLVAGGRVVGAIERVSAPGEWRTNISLGGTRREVACVPAEAAELAIAAAAALQLDLAGVDLLPTPDGHWTVLEVNGAVEFTDDYGLDACPFAATMEALTAPPEAVVADLAAV